MKERPILFSGPMVRAILEGRKSQTRRVMKPQPVYAHGMTKPTKETLEALDNVAAAAIRAMTPTTDCPYGVPGDRLWVREAWKTRSGLDDFNATEIAKKCLDAGFAKPGAPILYLADNHGVMWSENDAADLGPWGRVRSSRFMPRWASRITLEITDVRVQRVQEISEDDARSEGVYQETFVPSFRIAFGTLWDSINAKRGFGWESNPWVWALSFKAVRP